MYQVMEMYILIMFGHKTLDRQFHTSQTVVLIFLSNMGTYIFIPLFSVYVLYFGINISNYK